MTQPTKYPELSDLSDLQKLEAGTLDFYTSGLGIFGTSNGDLCSVNDVSIGNATDFPLTATTRDKCLQYLREVEKINWTLTYNYNDGAGRTESASESGSNYLAPFNFNPSSIPSVAGLAVRRQMLLQNQAIGLAMRADDGSDFVIVEDAVSRGNSSGPLSPSDLEIRFILFGNVGFFDRVNNLAHNSSSGEYYPKFYLQILTSRNIVSNQDSGNVVGTATVEDLGSCNLYYTDSNATVSFSATIGTRF